MSALVRKDWIELRRNRQVLVPIIGMPFVFALLVPTSFLLMMRTPEGLDHFSSWVGVLSRGGDSTLFAMIHQVFAPFFVMIPMVVASIMAGTAVVGERERHTIEGLLYTPASDREIVLAKIAATWLLAVGITWISFGAYAVMVNLVVGDQFDGWFFPTVRWALHIGLVVPLAAFFSVCAIIIVSQRARTMQGAQAVTGLVILPIIVFIGAQAGLLMIIHWSVVLVWATLLLVADLVLFWFAVRSFDGERIVVRL